MNKKLHKSLYSKKDKRPNFPTVNKVIQSNIDITDSINLDDVSLKKSSSVKNIYTLSLFTGFLLLGIVTYFSINSNTQIDTSRDKISNPTEVSDTIIKSTTTVPMPSTSTSTTTVSTTTTTVVKKEILNLEDAQYQLYELGLYTGEINGVLDTNTKTAIKEFQKLSGLVVDGILGPITKAALEKGEESYIIENNQAISVESSNNSALDLRYYNPNENCITGYVNSSQVWVPDPCFYPVFVYRYGQTAQVNSQAELDAYLNQNWSLTQEKIYNSLGEVPTQNYISGINSPVNGLPMPSGSNNSIVIGIKNDNNVRARPQSGPQKADAVFEVLVEGGMTRFINIFYQSDTSYHGPIRSARPTDPTVLRPLGGVLVASGATGGLIPEINDMGVPVITDRRPEYFRISSRKAPHNLYADTSKLKSIAVSKGCLLYTSDAADE